MLITRFFEAVLYRSLGTLVVKNEMAKNWLFDVSNQGNITLSLWTTQQILQHPVMGEQSCCEGQGAEQTGGLLG